ncbi:MAG: radical SAM protein [Elusimicrobia bacterium]|nr:radical SAM protein [Elusimicrobiota bacterium]
MKTSRLVLSCGCNQDCLFCDAGGVKRTAGAAGRAAALAADPGNARVNITGGEPTLHPGLPGLVRRLKKGGKYVALLTNGLRLASADYLRELAMAGLDEVVVSFFESEPERYDALAGVKGGFAKKAAALKNLRRSGIKTSVNFLVYSGNQSSAPALVRELRKKHGVKDIVLSLLEPDCERVRARRWLIPDAAAALRSLSAIAGLRRKLGLRCMLPAGGAVPPCVAEELGLHCPAGEVSGADFQPRLRVKPAGVCSACPHSASCPGFVKAYAVGMVKFLMARRRRG